MAPTRKVSAKPGKRPTAVAATPQATVSKEVVVTAPASAKELKQAKKTEKKKVGFESSVVDKKEAKRVAKAPAKAVAAPKGVVVASDKGKDAAKAVKKAKEGKAKGGKAKGGKSKEPKQDDASDSDSDVSDTPARSRRSAVEFRFLPEEFQEPQLTKYLSQFGSKVASCVCLRHKKTNSSRGIAIVAFKDDSVIPNVVEESNGMLLGGRTVRCKVVYLKRKLPPKKLTLERYRADLKRRVRGSAIKRFVNRRLTSIDPAKVKRKRRSGTEPEKPLVIPKVEVSAIVGAILKHAKAEVGNNEKLKKMGINYSFTGFEDQLKKVPKTLIKSKKEMKVIRADQKAAAKKAKEEAAAARPKKDKKGAKKNTQKAPAKGKK